MKVLRQSVATCLAVCMLVSTGAAQVAHVVDQAMLDRLLSERIAQDQADRAAILRLLKHQDVRTVASRLGVDLTRAHAAVSTLDGAELRSLAAQAEYVQTALAGGQSTITLSTTTIIIGLLVLILIVVVVS